MTKNTLDRIGGWLLKPGNTKEKLAELLGISVGTLNNYLSGATEPRWSMQRKLADILGCEVSDLI